MIMRTFKRSTITPKKSNFKLFKLTIPKREKFVLVSVSLSLGLLLTQIVDASLRYYVIAFLSICTILLSIWSIKEDARKIAWIMGPILPTIFTASIGLFFFLLPERVLVRVILITLFAIGMYALLLTENIFTVAAIRTIQLLRAAQALGFVMTLFTAFLLFDTVFSFRLMPWFNAILIFIIAFPLLLQGIWSINLEEKVTEKLLWYSFGFAWILAQLAFFISFWPLSIIIASLSLVTLMYVGLGIIQQAMVGRLFKQTIREYLQVGIVVFVIVLIAAKWGAQ
ncbi:hypothetical protein GYA19_02540 [Candidatus Beckwithbacteria bacterium]|nr:hypothetical protein [Candidatus Beckwithbacteria bacterium]